MAHFTANIKWRADSALELIYPPTCQHCRKPAQAGSGQPFCQTCHKQLQQLLVEQCPRCAAPYPGVNMKADNCPHCQNEDYAFTQALAWGSYQSVLRDIILSMKLQSNESLAYHIGSTFATQFADQLRSMPVDAVVPVPLHWTRRLWRGYNQAETLAQSIADQLKKPCRTSWLWRRMRTPHQASLTPLQRRKNLRQAMTSRIRSRHRGSHILLIDDVMTTGATADACSRALLAAGAKTVSIAVLARAVGTTATPGASPSL